MSKETKQDVFDEVLDAYGDAIAGGGQGDNGHPAEYRLRYAAATDGDPQCQYCHTPSGREVTKQEYINDYMVYEATGDPVDTLDNGMLAGIICCQWCGRRLEASHEPA